MVGSALIGAGGALLGGILGKPKVKSAYDNTRDAIWAQAKYAREAGAHYGWNPLTLLGASSAVGPSESSNYMGNAIANSAMLLADGLARREEKFGREAALQKQNEELKLQVRELTLRPKFGGIYAQRQAVPSLGAALGRSVEDGSGTRTLGSREAGAADPASARSGAMADAGRGGDSLPDGGNVGAAGLRPHATVLAVDPLREVEQEKGKPHSGFLTIDNPHAPFPLYLPTFDGDEAAGVTEVLNNAPWLGANYAYQYGKAWGRKVREHGLKRAHDAAWQAHDKDRQDRLMQNIGSKPRSRTTDYERRHRTRRGAP